LHRIVADLGRLQGELCYTHLKHHLAMRDVLSRTRSPPMTACAAMTARKGRRPGCTGIIRTERHGPPSGRRGVGTVWDAP
jgi:hypothetical protein